MNPYLWLVILLSATMLQCTLVFLIFTLTLNQKLKATGHTVCWCDCGVVLYDYSSEGPQNWAGASNFTGADHPNQRRQPVRWGPVHLLALYNACQDHQGLPHRPRWDFAPFPHSLSWHERLHICHFSCQPFNPIWENVCGWISSENTGVPTRPEITGITKPATEGDMITLTCTTTGSKPAARIQWLRNDKEVHGERAVQCGSNAALHPLPQERQVIQLLHSFCCIAPPPWGVLGPPFGWLSASTVLLLSLQLVRWERTSAQIMTGETQNHRNIK